MRFSILKPILSWQAWKKPQRRRSIRNRQNRRRKIQPLLPKNNSRKVRRTRKLMKRKPYKSPDQVKHNLQHLGIRVVLTLCYAWVAYEVVLSSFLLE